MTVLCSNSGCKHNGDEGYYGICNHPDSERLKCDAGYGGINRLLIEGCDKCERRNKNVRTKKS